MNVIVKLGEPFWRTAGQRTILIAMPAGATVQQVLAALIRLYPALAPELNNGEARPMLFVNDQTVEPETPLTTDATLHIVWPVSGG